MAKMQTAPPKSGPSSPLCEYTFGPRVHRWRHVQTIAMAIAFFLSGCQDVDPRCEELCTVQEPEIEGAFDICSQDGVDLCTRLCAARIKGQGTLCQSCLLEGATFTPDSQQTYSIKCNGTMCTITTSNQSTCDYLTTSEDSRQSCFRRLFPRKSVNCMPSFLSVGLCLPVCNGTPASAVPQPRGTVDMSIPIIPTDAGTMDLTVKG